MIMGTRENVFSTHILALKFNFMADTSFFRLFGTYIFLSFDNVAIGWLILPPDQPKKEVSANLLFNPVQPLFNPA